MGDQGRSHRAKTPTARWDSDGQGRVRSREHWRGVGSSEEAAVGIPGLYPKSLGEALEGFLPFFKGSGSILLCLLHRSVTDLKLQEGGEAQRGCVEAEAQRGLL